MKKNKMLVHYDSEGDFLEVVFGKPKPSYYEDIGDDISVRKDEDTNEVSGFSILNVKKRQEKQHRDLEINLPKVIA